MVHDAAYSASKTAGTVMKRRGILAAAAAVLAGIIAEQTSKPVAAADGPLVLASTSNQASGPTALQAASTFTGAGALITLQATTAPAGKSVGGIDIFASGADAHGIYTQGGAGGLQGYGVLAQGGAGAYNPPLSSSDGSPGVYASGGPASSSMAGMASSVREGAGPAGGTGATAWRAPGAPGLNGVATASTGMRAAGRRPLESLATTIAMWRSGSGCAARSRAA